MKKRRGKRYKLTALPWPRTVYKASISLGLVILSRADRSSSIRKSFCCRNSENGRYVTAHRLLIPALPPAKEKRLSIRPAHSKRGSPGGP